MNWYTIGGALLHILKHAPELASLVGAIFDIMRKHEKAPLEVWKAVTVALNRDPKVE